MKTDLRPSVTRTPAAANQGFTQLPNVVTFAANLSAGQVRLYAALFSYHRPGGWVFPGRAKLAHRLGVSTDTIDRDMAQLKAVGLITVWRRGLGKSNLYDFPDVSDDTLQRLGFVDESAHMLTLESELTRTHEVDED